MCREIVNRRLRGPRVAAIVLPLLIAGLAAPHEAVAQSGGLEGSWSGGGSVAFNSGQKERAQCRAQYRRASGNVYTLTATCATPSGRATQTATLRQVGGNSYQGQFHNSEYNVTGTIFVTASGNRQSVRLTSKSRLGFVRAAPIAETASGRGRVRCGRLCCGSVACWSPPGSSLSVQAW